MSPDPAKTKTKTKILYIPMIIFINELGSEDNDDIPTKCMVKTMARKREITLFGTQI